MTEDDSQNGKDKKVVMSVYGLMIISLVLQFIPALTVQIFALCLMGIAVLAAYVFRFGIKKDSFRAGHMTYLIGTVWIGSVLLSIGITIASFWFKQTGDHTMTHEMMNMVMQGVEITDSAMTETFFRYMKANAKSLILIGLLTCGPAIGYIVYRLARGFSRALKSMAIDNPKSWF